MCVFISQCNNFYLSLVLCVYLTNFVFPLGADDISISSRQLYSLLQENKTNILILDSRPASHYAESHMTIGNCINVPEDIVKPGWVFYFEGEDTIETF